jgi:hypothetical protein
VTGRDCRYSYGTLACEEMHIYGAVTAKSGTSASAGTMKMSKTEKQMLDEGLESRKYGGCDGQKDDTVFSRSTSIVPANDKSVEDWDRKMQLPRARREASTESLTSSVGPCSFSRMHRSRSVTDSVQLHNDVIVSEQQSKLWSVALIIRLALTCPSRVLNW